MNPKTGSSLDAIATFSRFDNESFPCMETDQEYGGLGSTFAVLERAAAIDHALRSDPFPGLSNCDTMDCPCMTWWSNGSHRTGFGTCSRPRSTLWRLRATTRGTAPRSRPARTATRGQSAISTRTAPAASQSRTSRLTSQPEEGGSTLAAVSAPLLPAS